MPVQAGHRQEGGKGFVLIKVGAQVKVKGVTADVGAVTLELDACQPLQSIHFLPVRPQCCKT